MTTTMPRFLRRLRPDVADESGWVLVTAISLLAIMLTVALASAKWVDTQQKRDRQQRERESSLNLAESALYQEGFKLAQAWPTQTRQAVDCSSTTSSASCPAAAQVQANATNVDTQAGTTWTAIVRDNGGPLASTFDPAQMDATQTSTVNGATVTCPGPCRYDANGDRKVWVEAQSIVRGRVRTVTATMKLERLAESIPQTAVVAGGINTGNNGNQTAIYAVGSQVIVRCDPNANGNQGTKCVSNNSKIQPQATQGTIGNLMTPSQIARFKAAAQANNTYYNGCNAIPGGTNSMDLTGAVVFVDNCMSGSGLAYPNNSTQCSSYLAQVAAPTSGNSLQAPCINSPSAPGIVIWHCGGFSDAGHGTFIGVMYFANNSDGTCTTPGQVGGNNVDCSGNKNSANNILAITGGLAFLGSVAIDGNGCLFAGSNGIQVQYDPNVFSAAASYGTVGLVQDTWREL